MAKRTGENQDYYKQRGGEVGRSIYASERKKLKQGEVSPRVSPAERSPGAEGRPVAVAAKGAGTETAKRGKKRQASKASKDAEEEVRRETVERVVQSRSPSAPPERMLPPAARSTELADFTRRIREDLGVIDRSSRELLGSLADLARTPARLLHLLRSAARAGS